MASEAPGPSMRRDDAVALLRNHGIIPTARRVDIAVVLLARAQHVCAEDVHRMLLRQGKPACRATVYNTLGLFARRGLVRELVVDSDKVLYDSNLASHDHIHDVDTGVLTDIEPGSVVVNALPSLPSGTRVERVDVVIRVSRSRPI